MTLLSSAHDPAVLSEVSRKNKKGERLKISCPLAIASYNKIMRAVDKFDKLKERHAIGRQLKISCPLAIASYNKIMRAVDKFDKLKERHAIGRHSRKWWHRILYFVIDLAIVNSYTMY